MLSFARYRNVEIVNVSETINNSDTISSLAEAEAGQALAQAGAIFRVQ